VPEARRHHRSVPRPSAATPDGAGLEVRQILPEGETDKPPLLFVHGAWHGAWCFAEHWMPEAAARGWPCYGVSLTGHGDSGGGEVLTLSWLGQYEDDIVATIDALPDAPVLIGHSMGGLLTQRVAASDPRVRAAVLVASVPPGHHLGALPLLARHDPIGLARIVVGAPPRFRPRTFYGSATDEATASRHTARMTRESLLATHQLVLPRRPRVPSCPTLVLGGGDDRLVSPNAVLRTARTMGTRPHMFRGMGHNLMLDDDWRAPLELTLEWLETTLSTA
jgi:pimeloyl-ACP methyl ester carboxylesterase